MAMSENTKAIFRFLQENPDKDYTAAQIADILGIDKAKVNGGFTGGIQKKGYGDRVLAEVELEDGSHEKVKILKLTEAGLNLNLDATEE